MRSFTRQITLRSAGTGVVLKFSDATLDDVAAIAGLQNAAAGALSARFGEGPWSSLTSERGAALALRHASVRIGRAGKRIYTVLRLATKKPWAIDVAYFTPVKRPLYLTGMAVSVAHQSLGLGRQALEDAHRIAQARPADAIRLDAYDGEGGAGGFYARCGYEERGRVVYRGSRLIYYELLLAPPEVTDVASGRQPARSRAISSKASRRSGRRP